MPHLPLDLPVLTGNTKSSFNFVQNDRSSFKLSVMHAYIMLLFQSIKCACVKSTLFLNLQNFVPTSELFVHEPLVLVVRTRSHQQFTQFPCKCLIIITMLVVLRNYSILVCFYWSTINVHELQALIGRHGFVHEPPVPMVRAQTIKCHFKCQTNFKNIVGRLTFHAS